MTTFLLDANVLIALTAKEHMHHRRASAWAAGVSSFAICPVVEGALVRFVVRMGGAAADAQRTLRLVGRRPGYVFWPDSVSYADAGLGHIRGHRQVTDAYLASLASAQPDARLATLDEALAAALPEAVTLIPA
ncbi:MAG: VapC toxin family PIN domain ribonuclease [Actinobacteria bacterium 69-20]|jgi:toxin-antitoxin system PIN domain toxin|nr:PIN domain-containing protein [Actinomycetota bacterium]OJV26123.1 MAG: VapC toxin family PIN domain ribonuclease [Actinobacteria bacterium 69-20]